MREVASYEVTEVNDHLQGAYACHCGKDGHALGSVNCPVHGYDVVLKNPYAAHAERTTKALAESLRPDAAIVAALEQAYAGAEGHIEVKNSDDGSYILVERYESPGHRHPFEVVRYPTNVDYAARAPAVGSDLPDPTPHEFVVKEMLAAGFDKAKAEALAKEFATYAAERRPHADYKALVDDGPADENDFFFDPRPEPAPPSAAVYDYDAIGMRAAELAFWEREITAASEEDIEGARRDWTNGRRPYRPNNATYNFDAIRYHLNVMRGDDINGTIYSHEKRWVYTPGADYGKQLIREHDASHGRCRACLWSAEAILDRIAPPYCAGHPPKGEPCINCGKPHVVTLPPRTFGYHTTIATYCVACGYGCVTDTAVPDRGAVRFEKRMKARAERDWNRNVEPVTPKIVQHGAYPIPEAAIRALLDSGLMDDGGPMRGHREDCPCKVCVQSRHNIALNRAHAAVAEAAFGMFGDAKRGLRQRDHALRVCIPF